MYHRVWRTRLLLVNWCLWFGLGFCYGPGQAVFAADKDDKDEQNQLRAEAVRSVRRLRTASSRSIDDLKQRFAELQEEGVPVTWLICEVIGTQGDKGTANALSVLEALSPSTAESARQLVDIDPATAGSPARLFGHYANVFEDLSEESDLDPALTPLIKRVLGNLVGVGNRVDSSIIALDERSDVYESGVDVIANCAEEDNGAFEVLLSLVAINPAPPNDAHNLFGHALRRLDVKDDADRARTALPVLKNVLAAHVRRLGGNRRGGIAASTLNQGTDALMMTVVLDAIAELGPAAAELAPDIRRLQNAPVFGDEASKALEKITTQ